MNLGKLAFLLKNNDVILAIGLVTIVLMMILPMSFTQRKYIPDPRPSIHNAAKLSGRAVIYISINGITN